MVKEKIFEINEHGQFVYKNLYSKKLQETFGNERNTNEKIDQFHLDLAKSVQKTYEDIFFHLLNIVYKEFKVDNLTISGGCAMNSVANGKIKSNTDFKEVADFIEKNDFESAVLKYSISDSSSNSGKIGWVNINNLTNSIKKKIL